MTGHTLDDIGSSLSWGALRSFLRKLEITSETAKELDPDLASWGGAVKTNAILADIYDILAIINANMVAMQNGKRAKKPKSYPRPGDKEKQRIGTKGALPPEELRKWFDEKRKQKKSKQ